MNNAQDLLVQQQEELKGIITLKSVFSKEQKLHIQPTRDSRTGWYLGVKQLSEEEKKGEKYVIEPVSIQEKNIRATTLTIRHGMQFNLNNDVDKLNWEWVKHCPAICSTFEEAQMTPGAIFYVENEEREATTSISKMEKIHKAVDYVMNDDTSYLPTRALLLGFNMQGEKPLVIKERLMKLASDLKTAQKVIDAYESSSLSIQLVFIEAKNKGLITVDNGAYILGDRVIGISQEAALEFLKSPENKPLVLQLEKDLRPELHPTKANTAKKVEKPKEEVQESPEKESMSLEELQEEELDENKPYVKEEKTVAKKNVPKKRTVSKKQSSK